MLTYRTDNFCSTDNKYFQYIPVTNFWRWVYYWLIVCRHVTSILQRDRLKLVGGGIHSDEISLNSNVFLCEMTPQSLPTQDLTLLSTKGYSPHCRRWNAKRREKYYSNNRPNCTILSKNHESYHLVGLTILIYCLGFIRFLNLIFFLFWVKNDISLTIINYKTCTL